MGWPRPLTPLASLEVIGWPRHLEPLASLELTGWTRLLTPLASLELIGCYRPKIFILRYNFIIFNQVRNLTFLNFFRYFRLSVTLTDLDWPWEYFFCKCHVKSFILTYNNLTFAHFEIWPHLVSNYGTSTCCTTWLEFFQLGNLIAVRMPYHV